MTLFGKSLSEYVEFEKIILILILAVGLARLGLSLAGLPTETVRWLSINAAGAIGILYCAIQVPRTGFGSSKHLLPLYFIQDLLGNLIVVSAILLAMATGTDNIYSLPDYAGGMDGKSWQHVMAHLVLGVIIAPLAAWLVGSIIMLIVRAAMPGARRKPAAA